MTFAAVETSAPAGVPLLMAAIVALPLAGSVLLMLFGRRLGRVSGVIASSTVGLAFIAGVIVFARLLGTEAEEREFVVHLFDWITVGEFEAGANLLFDQLSAVMVLVVTGVGTLIHVYSIGYMHDDEGYSRFFAYLNLFAASMLILVLGDNLLLLFVGWEGVGLCSYLLIGFWFERDSASNAAKKAFIVNRIGDFSFLLGIFLIAAELGSLDIAEINGNAGAMGAGLATIGALLLFGGATGK
ncbi:MAG: proton-conducting transporter membrane subunit, partial [Actinomycetota bacterium]